MRADPSRLPDVVEEVLRWDNPVPVVARNVFEPLTVGGATLQSGDRVVVVLGAGNRDPAASTIRTGFLPDRPDNVPLSFGWGVHRCVGAHLARLEAEVVFRRLLERFVIEPVEQDPPRLPGLMIRGPARLPVHLAPVDRPPTHFFPRRRHYDRRAHLNRGWLRRPRPGPARGLPRPGPVLRDREAQPRPGPPRAPRLGARPFGTIPRDREIRGELDVVVNMYSSFGFLETEGEDDRVVREIAGALKPGGRFFLDMSNPLWLFRNYHPQVWAELPDGTVLLEKRDYEVRSGRAVATWRLVRPDGRSDDIHFSMGAYTLPELVNMLHRCGLEPVDVGAGSTAAPTAWTACV